MIQPPLPERVGPYRVVRELGRGGMGVVYEARRDGPSGEAGSGACGAAIGRPLVLKAVLAHMATPEALRRFQREAELMARVRHPNVVAVHELLATPRGPVIVCDLVEGESLARRVRSGWRDDQAAARLVLQLADAVHALHQAAILHRDLKPENVIVRPDGTPVLLDFGIARDQTAERLTVTGALLGSPNYMAPEQANGERSQAAGTALGPATDVYGLGAILFELLAGRPPHHDATSLQGLLVAIAAGKPPLWPRATRPDVPLALEAVVRVAMAPRPADRYPSAAALRDDLARVLAGGRSEAEGKALPRRAPGPGLVLAGAVTLALSIAGLVVALVLGAGPPAPATEPPAPTTEPPARSPAPEPGPAPAPADWRQLARALKPDVDLAAAGPTLLRSFPVRAELEIGAAGWLSDATHLVTIGAGEPPEPAVVVRSLLRPDDAPVPSRHGSLWLLAGTSAALAPDEPPHRSEGRALVDLDPATLAPRTSTPLPLAVRLDRLIVAEDGADGLTIACVASGADTEVVVLRRRAAGAVVELGRIAPPGDVTGLLAFALRGPRLVVSFTRRGAALDPNVERGEAVFARLDGQGLTEVGRRALEDRITTIGLSGDGARVCLGTSTGQACVGDPDRPDGLWPLQGPQAAEELVARQRSLHAMGVPFASNGWLSGAAFARDGRLYTASLETDFTTWSELRRWTLAPSAPPEGRAQVGGQVVLRPVRPGAEHPRQLHGLRASPDGRLLLLQAGADVAWDSDANPRKTGACAVEVWLVDGTP